MKLLLIVLLSLAGAKKEAVKRWPNGIIYFKIDVSENPYKYEMDVTILMRISRNGLAPQCKRVVREFTGKNWQEVMDKSKDFRSDCTELELF